MNQVKFHLVSIVVLAAVALSSVPAFAYPSSEPEVYPIPAGCRASLPRVAALYEQFDILDSRAEYSIADRLDVCAVAMNVQAVPVTGFARSRYAAFKELQAEQMDK